MELILDENIIVFAAKMQDESGKQDKRHAKVLFDILDRCDIIHCSKELYAKYLSKLDSLDKSNYSNSYVVTRVLVHLLSLGKLRMHDNPPSIDPTDEQKIPYKDVFLIRLAIATKAIVVTSDVRLREKLRDAKLLEKYQLNVRGALE